MSTFSKELSQSKAVTPFAGAKAAPAILCALAAALCGINGSQLMLIEMEEEHGVDVSFGFFKLGNVYAALALTSLYGCTTYSDAPPSEYLDAEYECGVSYADQKLRWTLLESPPNNFEGLLSLSKDGQTAAAFLKSGGTLPDEYWFRRPQEFLVCNVDSQSSCGDKTGKLVSFDRHGSWEINEMSELICLQ